MSEQFRFGLERTYKDSEKPTIRLDVAVHFDNDAPPALASAIMEGVGKLIAMGCDEDTARRIEADILDIKARKQREADRVARLLVGEEEPPADGP